MALTTSTSYLGLTLAHPFILGASPLTGHLDNARRLEDGGCAAIVMHSLFEEQIAQATAGKFPGLERATPEFVAATAQLPVPERFPLGPDEYLEQIRRFKGAVSIPVIGSLNGVGADGWLSHARLIEQAGADALELNVYYLSTGTRDSSTDIERHLETLVRDLTGLVKIPIAVKLLPFYTALANLAARLDAAGASGLVLFNRFYQPDIDVETLAPVSNIHLSTNTELLLRVHWVAILSERVRPSLAVSGGVHSVADGIRALVSGAHAVQMVSAVLEQGPQHFREMEQGLRSWMTHHQHESVEAFRGRVNLKRSSDPASFERASYLRMLQSWSR